MSRASDDGFGSISIRFINQLDSLLKLQQSPPMATSFIVDFWLE